MLKKKWVWGLAVLCGFSSLLMTAGFSDGDGGGKPVWDYLNIGTGTSGCLGVWNQGSGVGIACKADNNNSFWCLGTSLIEGGALETGEAASEITFENATDSISTYGLRIESTPLDMKGAQSALQTTTSIYGASNHVQEGTAKSTLSNVAGYNSSGNFQGVVGQSYPKVLDNYDSTMVSRGLGGRFTAQPDQDPLPLNGVGTYWVGGVYGEVKGEFSGNSTGAGTGAVAGVIGVDISLGSVDSYAGYFQGKVRITDVLHLDPMDATPTSGTVGDLFVSSALHPNGSHIYCWLDGSGWVQLD